MICTLSAVRGCRISVCVAAFGTVMRKIISHYPLDPAGKGTVGQAAVAPAVAGEAQPLGDAPLPEPPAEGEPEGGGAVPSGKRQKHAAGGAPGAGADTSQGAASSAPRPPKPPGKRGPSGRAVQHSLAEFLDDPE